MQRTRTKPPSPRTLRATEPCSAPARIRARVEKFPDDFTGEFGTPGPAIKAAVIADLDALVTAAEKRTGNLNQATHHRVSITQQRHARWIARAREIRKQNPRLSVSSIATKIVREYRDKPPAVTTVRVAIASAMKNSC